MREIKFRAWHKKEGEMLCEIYSLTCYAQHGEVSGIMELDYEDLDYPDDIELMQYTGMKDKNGVEIYEGDILDNGGGFGPMVVKFGEWDNGETYDDHQCGLGFYVECPKFRHEIMGLTYIDIHKTHPIVGNIYENPGLLE